MADDFGYSSPCPGAASVVLLAMQTGEEIGDFGSMQTVTAFQNGRHHIYILRAWRDIFIGVPAECSMRRHDHGPGT